MLILIFLDWLPIWAAAMASAFVAVTLRQFMVGRLIDITASLIIFALLFVTNSYYRSELWTGILLLVGAAYIFIRECYEIYEFKANHALKARIIEKQHSKDEDDPED